MHLKIDNDKHPAIEGEFVKNRHSDTLLVICHGYKSTSKHPAIVTVVRGLNDCGYNTFIFDFSPGSELDLSQQSNEISKVLDYFKHFKHAVVLAPSLGALSSSITAADNAAIDGLITVNGFFGYSHLGPKFYFPYKYSRLMTYINKNNKKIWQTYANSYRPQNIKVPVLVMHSKTDSFVSAKQSLKFYDLLNCPKKLLITEDFDHNLTSKQSRLKTVELIDTWLQQTYPSTK